MAYSDNTYYTWIAGGKAGLRATPVTYSNVILEEPPFTEYTIGFPEGVSPIMSWTGMDAYNADTSSAVTIYISGGDVRKLTLRKRDMTTVWVEVYDQNNNRLTNREYGIGPSEFNYNRWCRSQSSPYTYAPLYLYMAAIPGTAPYGGIHFSFAGDVFPLTQVKYTGWIGSQIDLYAGSGGDRELQLMDELLDGVYLDHEGIAPTGGTGGGGGYFSRPDEEVGVPGLPSVSVCDTGFVSLYKVTAAEMRALATFMWDDNFYNSIVKNFNSPMENIISLKMVPFNPGGDPSNIVIGNLDSGVGSTKLSTSYFHISCGKKDVPEFFKSFADYSPYTPAVHCFLPFVGIVQLSPDDVMGGSIKIDYNIDVFSGACVAFISCNTNGKWHVLQQHQGQITAEFPLSGQNFLSVYNSMISAGSKIVGGAVQGFAGKKVNAGAAADGLIGGAMDLMNAKPDYLRSGSVSSTAGMMGTQYPYLIFSTPQYIMAENYREVKGYTSNLKCHIGSCSGFLQATTDNSELSSIPCTEEERNYIRQMLAEGIYV